MSEELFNAIRRFVTLEAARVAGELLGLNTTQAEGAAMDAEREIREIIARGQT